MRYDKKTTAARKKLLRDLLIGDPDTPTAVIKQRFAAAGLLPPPGHGTIAEARATSRKSRAHSRPPKAWTEEAAVTQKALEPLSVSNPTQIDDDQVVVVIGTTENVAAVLHRVFHRRRR